MKEQRTRHFYETSPPLPCLLIVALTLFILSASTTAAQACIRPETPLPPYSDDPPETREIIKQQYLRYFDELQAFFKCLDQQRQEAFKDAQKANKAWENAFGRKSE